MTPMQRTNARIQRPDLGTDARRSRSSEISGLYHHGGSAREAAEI